VRRKALGRESNADDVEAATWAVYQRGLKVNGIGIGKLADPGHLFPAPLGLSGASIIGEQGEFLEPTSTPPSPRRPGIEQVLLRARARLGDRSAAVSEFR
jgi:hypothetical protein